VFWFNIGSNKSTFEYIMVINNANTSTNTFDIVQNAQTDIGKNEEVISYVISSDNEINDANQVADFNGAMDFFSSYFYHPKACKRVGDVAKKNNPSIAVSSIQRSQTRLGNQLSNFASGYAIWRDFGILNYMDPEQLHIIGKAFKLPKYNEEDDNASYYTWFKGCLKFVDTIKWTTFNQTLLDVSAPPRQHLDALKRGHYIKLPTYIADFRGFIKYANDLKTDVFKFHKKWQSIARKLFDMMITSAKNNSKGSQVQEKPFITVSIHIRLTDFGQHLQRFWNVSLATQDYFTSAMQYFEDKYENVLFYVISDDMKSAKEYIHTEQNKKFNIAWPYNGAVKEGSNTWPQTDLALLSLSNHSIITFGTFGLWGSLLGNGYNRLTVCPKDYRVTDIGKEVYKAKLPNWIFL